MKVKQFYYVNHILCKGNEGTFGNIVIPDKFVDY